MKPSAWYQTHDVVLGLSLSQHVTWWKSIELGKQLIKLKTRLQNGVYQTAVVGVFAFKTKAEKKGAGELYVNVCILYVSVLFKCSG